MPRAATPPILRKNSKARRRRDSGNASDDLIASDVTMATDVTYSYQFLEFLVNREMLQDLEDMHAIVDSEPTPITGTPSKYTTSPIRQLPFSPSQFLNSPNISFDVTLSSTPVKRSVAQVTTPHKDRNAKPVSALTESRKQKCFSLNVYYTYSRICDASKFYEFFKTM